MIDQLTDAFAVTNHVRFSDGENGMPVVLLENRFGSATAYLHGAHVTDLRLNTHPSPVLWMSPKAVFADGKAIRGGVPICWPWFGPHSADESKPNHGFARNRSWSVAGSKVDDGEVTVSFSLSQDDATLELWPHEFELEYSVSLSDRLAMRLQFWNTGSAPASVGGALHSYFKVSQIENSTVEFGKPTEYYDQLEDMARKRQEGPVVFDREVDRIYIPDEDVAHINDVGFDRIINVTSQGSRSAVVWNPWTEKAKRMGDFPDDGYRTMLCVETANAADDVHTIEPNAIHVLEQTISIADAK